MEISEIQNVQNPSYNKFICVDCNYSSCRKSQFNRHLLTAKHLRNHSELLETTKSSNNICINCEKEFKTFSGLWKHKKKCIKPEKNNEQNNNLSIDNNTILDKEYIIEYIKQNNEIKDLLLKENEELKNQIKLQNNQLQNQQEQISELIPKLGNNNTINNNNNQKLNINVFLNEHCKDAISINDFIQSIKISLKNLLTTKEKGINIGINEIINENMNKLSLYKRPIHCTDKKRETLYVKHEKWEKDIDKVTTTSMLKGLQLQQIKSLHLWKEAHPNYNDDEELKHEYILLVNKCTKSLSDHEKKLFKNLCDNTYIKDEDLLIN